MAKPDLGTKRSDPENGRKFYDLGKDPIVSPHTGKSYPKSFFDQPESGSTKRVSASARYVHREEKPETDVDESRNDGEDLAPPSDADDAEETASDESNGDRDEEDETEREGILARDYDEDDDDMSSMIDVPKKEKD